MLGLRQVVSPICFFFFNFFNLFLVSENLTNKHHKRNIFCFVSTFKQGETNRGMCLEDKFSVNISRLGTQNSILHNLSELTATDDDGIFSRMRCYRPVSSYAVFQNPRQCHRLYLPMIHCLQSITTIITIKHCIKRCYCIE